VELGDLLPPARTHARMGRKKPCHIPPGVSREENASNAIHHTIILAPPNQHIDIPEYKIADRHIIIRYAALTIKGEEEEEDDDDDDDDDVWPNIPLLGCKIWKGEWMRYS